MKLIFSKGREAGYNGISALHHPKLDRLAKHVWLSGHTVGKQMRVADMQDRSHLELLDDYHQQSKV